MTPTKRKLIISEIIDRRTVERNTKALQKVKQPRDFYLVGRGNKIVGIWCRNLKKSDSIICRISRPEKGFTEQEWDVIVKQLIHVHPSALVVNDAKVSA